jgi:hypothetical protein
MDLRSREDHRHVKFSTVTLVVHKFFSHRPIGILALLLPRISSQRETIPTRS